MSATPPPPSITPPPGGNEPIEQRVGTSFVKAYYRCLSSTPQDLHKYYDVTDGEPADQADGDSPTSQSSDSSETGGGLSVSLGDEKIEVVRGKDSIRGIWERGAKGGINWEGAGFDLTDGSVDSQMIPGQQQSILLTITGVITLADVNASVPSKCPFVQTFVLRKNKKNKYVASERSERAVRRTICVEAKRASCSTHFKKRSALISFFSLTRFIAGT